MKIVTMGNIDMLLLCQGNNTDMSVLHQGSNNDMSLLHTIENQICLMFVL